MRCSTDNIKHLRKNDTSLKYLSNHNDIPNHQYSDYPMDSDTDTDLERSENLSGYMVTSLNDTDMTDDRNLSSEMSSFRRTSATPVAPSAVPSESTNWLMVQIWSISVVVVIVALAGVYAINQDPTPHAPVCNFKELKSKYPAIRNLVWKSLQLGTESVANVNLPSIFLFVYIDEYPNQLIQQIVTIASECLDSGVKPMIMSSADFTSRDMLLDYGVAIDQIRPKLIQSQVLLIKDLNKISAKVAQAFHTICDPITPLVARSVIFLTMRLNVPPHEDQSILGSAEQQLRNDWRGLEENILQPLLTRVTDQVLLLH